MKRDQRPFDADLQVLVERARTIPRTPDVVRARAMARARATVATATASPAALAVPARGRGLRIALAASVALLIGAASAAAALRGWIPQGPEPSPQPGPRLLVPAPASVPNHPAPPAVPSAAMPIAKPQRAARLPSAQESYAAELELLQRAQAAYTQRDFSNALILVAEHGRRFPNGRLAEQRDALRVRSLVGSGRANEARRAVAAFALRFPRSVLLQRLRETARAAE
jgi:hypothetical protein